MTQTNILVEISETLEQVQLINPELYGEWYSKLYPPYGDNENWNVNTLKELKQIKQEREAL
jgi:hypothetical protein